jgi:hypothetical protein
MAAGVHVDQRHRDVAGFAVSAPIYRPGTAGGAPLASPAFTGTPTAPTPAATDSSTTIANTAFVWAHLPIAHKADSTATGGNARGTSAVDLQTSRSTNTMVASGNQSVLVGGDQNTVSGAIASLVGGQFNTVNGTRAFVGGGFGNTASGLDSWVPGGYGAHTRGTTGRGAWGAGQFAAAGDAQAGEYVLRKQTTDATISRLTTDAAAASTTNTLNLPNFAVYAGRLIVTAKAAGAVNAAVWRIDLAAARGNGVGTTVMIEGTSAGVAPTASTGTVTGWVLTIAADTTNGGIAISGTGAAATTINWVARYMDVEVVTAS